MPESEGSGRLAIWAVGIGEGDDEGARESVPDAVSLGLLVHAARVRVATITTRKMRESFNAGPLTPMSHVRAGTRGKE